MRFKPKEDSFSGKVFKSLFHMFSGNTINSFTSLLSGYFYALILGPSVYGIWQTARVFQMYPVIFSLSVPFVIQRDFAILKGEGKDEEAKKLAHLLFTYSLIITPVVSILLISYALFFVEDVYFKFSLLSVAVIYLIGIITGYGDLLTKSINNYKVIANVNYITGGFALLSIPFVYYFGFYPIIISVVVSSIVVMVFYIYNKPEVFGIYWDYKLFKKLVIVAFPLYLVNIASTVFDSIDRLIIASMLSFKDVGMYSLSSFISNPISLLVNSTSIVLFTQLISKYGNSRTPEIVLKHVKIPQELFSQLIPPVIGMGLVALPLLTQVFLPKYVEGVLSAQIYIFAIYFYLLAGFSSNALFVLNKQKLSALSFLIAGIIKTVGSIILIKAGFSINGVAFSTVIAYLIYDLIMFWFIYKNLSISISEYLKISVDKLLPALVILLSVFAINYAANILLLNIWLKTIMAEIIVLAISLPFLFKFKKRISPYFT